MGKVSGGFRGYFRPDLTDDRCVLSKFDTESLNDVPVRRLERSEAATPSTYLNLQAVAHIIEEAATGSSKAEAQTS